ncbi:MAG: hypothetical protein ACLPWS_15240 [Rhodomicrobium sp.]
MKVSLTRQIIGSYLEGFIVAGADRIAGGLRALTLLLDQFADEQMSTFLDRAQKSANEIAKGSIIHSQLCSAGEVSKQLEILLAILGAAKIQPNNKNDLKALVTFLHSFSESEKIAPVLDKLGEAMKPKPIEQQIAEFTERLEKETGTPVFEQTLAELSASALKREHVVEIAQSVYGQVRKNTSRKAALDFIKKPHNAYITAKRGIEATGGRSAS